ncbi:hypothetical protein O181_053039 [Austropuccinia psidii MF-1]|uniref:Uncharacterized protein n=1 Tax=Austropuccinia psidii MF-1 TaxID=1389203 RepID=A0A9Q3HS99_9BASI|nr:hypothetical protein [Austropuccinia psidii MF-1]
MNIYITFKSWSTLFSLGLLLSWSRLNEGLINKEKEGVTFFNLPSGKDVSFLSERPDPRWNHPSLTSSARHVFYSAGLNIENNVDPTAYSISSMENFKSVCKEIDHSVQKGNVIHVEDGEADDHFASGIEVMDGTRPQMILLVGGLWKIRRANTEQVWKQYADKFDFEIPRIRTLEGELSEDKLADFDKNEGAGFEEKWRERLTHESLKNVAEYNQEVKEAKEEVQTLLRSNEFTTIVLKTAPREIIIEILKEPEFSKKVAIVWSQPIGMLKNGGFIGRFNWDQGKKASQALINLQIPIVATARTFGSLRKVVAVDKSMMPLYRKYAKFRGDFEGFDNIIRIGKTDGGVISKYLQSVAESFQQHIISEWQNKVEGLRKKEKEATDEKALKSIQYDLEEAQKLLGAKWAGITAKLQPGETFREFCLVDSYTNMVINKEVRESAIKQVLQVTLRTEQVGKETIILPRLDLGDSNGNVFLLSKWEDELITAKMQALINWLAMGEPARPKNIQSSSK